MIMLKRCYLLILAIFTVAGCTHRGPNGSASAFEAVGVQTTRYVQVSQFNQVDVQGRMNISLHTGYSKPQLILKGDPRDLAYVQTKVRQGTLYIALGSGYPRFGEVSADVRGKFLNKFRYVGAGVVRGKQLSSSYLTLYIDNQGTTQLGGYLGLRQLFVRGGGLVQISGISSPYLEIHLKDKPKVQLTGMANVSKLDLDGGGWLSLYWIKSNNLRIRAKDAARIQLAGMVNRLEVELWGTAYFKGRYLRAQRSFVKTHGKSVAEIASVNHQSTLATDSSDILYYNLSTTRADFMGFNGAVLDMRDWNDPFYKDFSKYNHQYP